MRHGIALWKELSRWSPMFTEGKTAYHRFLSLANQLPVIYMPKNKDSVEGSLLMPGIPVSEGSPSSPAASITSDTPPKKHWKLLPRAMVDLNRGYMVYYYGYNLTATYEEFG
jgi:hypothetical protein